MQNAFETPLIAPWHEQRNLCEDFPDLMEIILFMPSASITQSSNMAKGLKKILKGKFLFLLCYFQDMVLIIFEQVSKNSIKESFLRVRFLRFPELDELNRMNFQSKRNVRQPEDEFSFR